MFCADRVLSSFKWWITEAKSILRRRETMIEVRLKYGTRTRWFWFESNETESTISFDIWLARQPPLYRTQGGSSLSSSFSCSALAIQSSHNKPFFLSIQWLKEKNLELFLTNWLGSSAWETDAKGGDDVIPYVPVSVSLDKSTSESVDPSVSVSSSRSADPGLVWVYDIPRSSELL